jgi:hypothetical protein
MDHNIPTTLVEDMTRLIKGFGLIVGNTDTGQSFFDLQETTIRIKDFDFNSKAIKKVGVIVFFFQLNHLFSLCPASYQDQPWKAP